MYFYIKLSQIIVRKMVSSHYMNPLIAQLDPYFSNCLRYREMYFAVIRNNKYEQKYLRN